MVHEMGERFTQTASLMSGMRRVKWPSATGIGQLPASLPVKNSCSELIRGTRNRFSWRRAPSRSGENRPRPAARS